MAHSHLITKLKFNHSAILAKQPKPIVSKLVHSNALISRLAKQYIAGKFAGLRR